MRLLLVEDDPQIIALLKPELQQQGYAVEIACNGIDGEFAGTDRHVDLIVLDLGLPGKSGLTLLNNWRAAGVSTPVLILTGRDAWHERVDGLKAGADDYMGKPFHIEELLARIAALIRRRNGITHSDLQVGLLRLSNDQQTVTDGAGQCHALTGIEFRLLRYFMMNPGVILSKTLLSEHVYEEEMLRDSNVIEVYVNRLRQLLGKTAITTKRGQGYSFTAAHPRPRVGGPGL